MESAQMPPNDVTLEESILYSMMLGDANIIDEVRDILRPVDFYKTAHQHIYETILDIHHRKKPVDLLSVKSALDDAGRLDMVGGVTYLTGLNEAPLAVNAPHYARRVHEMSVRRLLIKSSQLTMADAFNTSNDLEILVEKNQKRALAINNRTEPEYSHARDDVMDAIERYEHIHTHKGLVTGVEVGMSHLDRVLSGMQPSDLIIVAARPSMGKTSLALQLARGAAENDVVSMIFSLEQPKEQLYDRIFAADTRIPTTSFRTGYFSKTDWVAITESAHKISELSLIIDDRGGQTYRDICKTARYAVKNHNVGVIFIDHLQLVNGAGNKSRNNEVGVYTRAFKALAKELKIPVVALSQLSRNVDNRGKEYHRPQLSDLRDSGNIEQDADVVIFIYRDDVYNTDENNPNRGRAELIVAKQRQGPVCTITMLWFAKYTTFAPLATDTQDYCNYD